MLKYRTEAAPNVPLVRGVELRAATGGFWREGERSNDASCVFGIHCSAS
jgi:hypothetical protein